MLGAAGDGLDDDLAAVDFGGVHHFDAAMIGAVGDADLERLHLMPLAILRLDNEVERAEAVDRPERPEQIAEAAQPALEAVRDGGADHRREADRGAVRIIIAVDHAEIDAAAPAGGDRPDRAFEIERDAERSGEAVRGAERQQREDAVAVDQLVDRAGERAVAAADDHHRRAVAHRRLDGGDQLLRIAHRMRGDQADARAAQQRNGAAEQLSSRPRTGVDDEHGFLGDGTRG